MRLLARVLNALCALLALAAVTVTAAFLLLDPNDYKARVIDAVQAATGRTLTLGGELTLTRSLWPTLQASDVRLANLPGGSRPDMAHAERIEAQISLLALLARRIELTRLVLTGPNILFEQVGGKPNWVFSPASPPSPAPAPTSASASANDHSFDLRVRTAEVRNGMVTWKLPARTKVVGIRALQFQRKRADGPVHAHATLVYSDNQPFTLDLDAQPGGGLMDPWRTDLRFAAFDTTATATGTVSVAGPFDLRVNATSGATEKLNALLPEMRLPPLHGATLSARLVNGARPGDIPVIGPAELRFASADLRGRLPGLQLGATRLTLPAPGGKAAIDGAGSYAGGPFHLTGSVGVPLHADGPSRLPVALTLAAGPKGTAALEGTLAVDTLRFAGLDAAATLQADALDALRDWLGDAVPALDDVRFRGQVSLPAGLFPAKLRDVSLRSAQGDVAGEGTVQPGALSGTWRSDALDLGAMLDAFGLELAPTPAKRTGPVIPDTRLPWSSLRGKSLDLSLAVAAMQFAGETWRDVRMGLSLRNGRLEARPVSLAMPGARLQAALSADAGSGAVSFTLSAPALPLPLLARQFGVPGPVAGAANVAAQLHASGQTVRDLAGTLDGTFSIASVGGQFSNRALIGLTGAALDALGIHVPPEGDTRLDCLGLTGAFAGGRGTLRTIALQTTYLSLEGTGQVDLGHETLAMQLQPMARVAGSPVAVPVVVQGPFRDIKGRLDADFGDKLGFLLDGLFGGDRARVCETAGLR